MTNYRSAEFLSKQEEYDALKFVYNALPDLLEYFVNNLF